MPSHIDQRSPLSLQMQLHSTRVWKHLPSAWTHWEPHYREHKNLRPHPTLQGDSVDKDIPLNQINLDTEVPVWVLVTIVAR